MRGGLVGLRRGSPGGRRRRTARRSVAGGLLGTRDRRTSRAGPSSPSRRRPAGTGRCSAPSALSEATTRAFGRVVARRRGRSRRSPAPATSDVVGLRPQELVARAAPASSRRLAPREALEEAALGDVQVAVDVQRGHLVDGARRGQPAGRLGREAAAVAGRRVGPDLLLGRVDDVQVVQAAARVRARTCRSPGCRRPTGGRR